MRSNPGYFLKYFLLECEYNILIFDFRPDRPVERKILRLEVGGPIVRKRKRPPGCLECEGIPEPTSTLARSKGPPPGLPQVLGATKVARKSVKIPGIPKNLSKFREFQTTVNTIMPNILRFVFLKNICFRI